MSTVGCLLTSNFSPTCEDRQTAGGGLRPIVWFGNLIELDRTQGDQGFEFTNGYISNIFLLPGTYLYAWEGVKNGNQNSSSLNLVAQGGNVVSNQTVTFKVFDNTPQSRDALLQMAYSDIYAITESSQGRFELFGKDLGLNIIDPAEKASGTDPQQETVRTVVFAGVEPELPKFVLDTDASTTRALLNSLTYQ